jgi:hypothetical protein
MSVVTLAFLPPIKYKLFLHQVLLCEVSLIAEKYVCAFGGGSNENIFNVKIVI